MRWLSARALIPRRRRCFLISFPNSSSYTADTPCCAESPVFYHIVRYHISSRRTILSLGIFVSGVVLLKIEILGPDCEPLRAMAAQAAEIARRLSTDYEISRITGIEDILRRGVTLVPAIIVDGNEIGSGRILSREALEGLLADSAE